MLFAWLVIFLGHDTVKYICWFRFFDQWYIKVRGLFNAEVILIERQWYYLTDSLGDMRGHAFP